MMKKLESNQIWTRVFLKSVMLIIFTLSVSVAVAIPAYPKFVTIVQPDGTTLEIRKHGDEFFSWTTTKSGHTVMQKNDYYYYVNYDQTGKVQFSNQRVSQAKSSDSERRFISKSPPQKMSAIASVASNNRRRMMFSNMQKVAFPNKGNVKSIIILVEFQDVRFEIPNPQTAFTNLLNEEGYTNNYGAEGSAKDYFLKSSGGDFIGRFDVVGPYTVSQNMAYYGGNDEKGNDLNPKAMVKEAVKLADNDGVDFSQYDYDGDGIIDNVFIYYAGYNEAEFGLPESIWPHKWAIYEETLLFDGKRLLGYACSSELRGNFYTNMAGIGTFCHEFSHVFGLADHYDTDASDDSYNEKSPGLGYYDVMTSGSYNNSGNTPPLFNALEMKMIGWIEPKLFDGNLNDIVLQTIDHKDTYMIPTEVEGEYFLIENRQKNDPDNIWDKYIPASGLLITHVDRSAGKIELWDLYNTPNGNSTHECFKFVVAGDIKLKDEEDFLQVPYPYTENNEFTRTSSPRAVSWSGINIPYNICNISNDGINIVFDVKSLSAKPSVKGVISEDNGDVIANALILFDPISRETKSNEGARATGNTLTTNSNSNGEYSIEILSGKYNITVVQQGYNTYSGQINIDIGINELNVNLIRIGNDPMIFLDKYEYDLDVPINLKMINTDESDTIIWRVDGVLINNLEIKPSRGKHTIKAEVTRVDNVKYVVVKQIIVK